MTVVTYTFNIINEKLAEIKIDNKVWKLIIYYRIHHLKTDAKRPKVKREKDGKGSIQQELTDKTTSYRIQEIFRRYNRLDATGDKHTRDAKEFNL